MWALAGINITYRIVGSGEAGNGSLLSSRSSGGVEKETNDGKYEM
jgi:hypothetical protein